MPINQTIESGKKRRKRGRGEGAKKRKSKGIGKTIEQIMLSLSFLGELIGLSTKRSRAERNKGKERRGEGARERKSERAEEQRNQGAKEQEKRWNKQCSRKNEGNG